MICAIIVTYHPDVTVLKTLLEKLHPQVNKLLIINNTATTELDTQLDSRAFHKEISIINPAENIGLGAAYNLGADWAKKNAFDFILLFDQDSAPADDMVFQLLKAYRKLSDNNEKIAVVGPNHTDIRTNVASYAAQLSGCKIKKCYCDPNKTEQYIPASHIISSGSLIALKNLETIGLFDEGLFIDYVDIEWGLRAASKGYLSYYICPAVLYHRMGDNLVKLFGRLVPFYNPLRCFYISRNTILLCKRNYIPFGLKVRIIYQCIQRYLFYIVRSSTKFKHIKMMSLGIWHGLLGRTGR
jgi:rhamnosyltransferase